MPVLDVWTIIQQFHTFLGDSQINQLFGAVDNQMNFRKRLKVEGDSSSGGPQRPGADSFDCRPERYEIVVFIEQSIFQETVLFRSIWSINTGN